MQTINAVKDMHTLSREFSVGNKRIGFIPTMGALHEGHLSLVRRAKEENDLVVVSIFVNPIQFGPNEDFKKYPRDVNGDLDQLSRLDIDAVFVPEGHEMYPEGFSTIIDIGAIGSRLCGLSRPGHFNGVATIVSKLFNIIMPDKAYFGQKDFQQTVVIKKLAKELNFDIDIIACPTVREADGLAMSSRNRYLSADERKSAAILYKALNKGKDLINRGVNDVLQVNKEIVGLISSEPLANIEYAEIVDPGTLEKIEKIRKPAVICLAVKIGNTRLIDNVIVE